MPNFNDRDARTELRRRDVSSSFVMQRAEHTPISTMITKGSRPRSSEYEWPFRGLHTPEDSAVADGVEVDNADNINNDANKVMLRGRTQKGRVPYGVGDVAEELYEEHGGTGSILKDNARDALIKAKENMETTLLKTGDSILETGAAVPNRLRGLSNWVRSANPGSPDLAVPALALAPATSILSVASENLVTEDNFRDLMQSVAETSLQAGDWYVFCTPLMKRTISNWGRTGDTTSTTVPLRRFNANQESGKIKLSIQFYESDFGMLKVQTHYRLPTGVFALIVDMSSVKMRPLRNPTTFKKPYLGGGHNYFIEYILGLQCDNPQAHAKIIST